MKINVKDGDSLKKSGIPVSGPRLMDHRHYNARSIEHALTFVDYVLMFWFQVLLKNIERNVTNNRDFHPMISTFSGRVLVTLSVAHPKADQLKFDEELFLQRSQEVNKLYLQPNKTENILTIGRV